MEPCQDNSSSDELIEVVHMPGVLVLKEHYSPMHNVSIDGWGRSFAYYFPEQANTHALYVSDYHTTTHAAQQQRAKKRHRERWIQLFDLPSNVDRDLHFINIQTQEEIRVGLNDSTPSIVPSVMRKVETYAPTALLSNNKVVDGMHLNLWRAATSEQSATSLLPLTVSPVRAMVTGMCMLGTNLIGIDQSGHEYHLFDPEVHIPPGHFIQEVVLHSERFHPYEEVELGTFPAKFLLADILGNGHKPVIYFHGVLSEYIVNGLNYLLTSKMTHKAFLVYCDIVTTHAMEIRKQIQQMCNRQNYILHFFSPLDSLILNDGSFCLDKLFTKLDMDSFLDVIKQNNLCPFVAEHAIIPSFVVNSVKWLSRCHDTAIGRRVWQFTIDQLLQGNIGITTRHGMIKTSSLADLSYAALFAMIKCSTINGYVLACDSLNHRTIGLKYKSHYCEEFGEILCCNWVPSIISHIAEKKDNLYLTKRNHEQLHWICDAGIPTKLGQQTGLVVLMNSNNNNDVREAKTSYQKTINTIRKILNKHDINHHLIA